MPPDSRRLTGNRSIAEPKVYHPTWDEFKDFNKFMEKVELDGAGECGIIKVVPPKEFIPRKAGYKIEDLNYQIEHPILQKFTPWNEKGAYQTKATKKTTMSVADYYKICHQPENLPPPEATHDEIERKYWRNVTFSTPLYGADVSAPLSDPELDVWNIPKLGCILDVIKDSQDERIEGVLSPYLYFGMWKATFSWHIEDLDLFAINMVHYGAPKTWYCVPPKYGHLLEKAAQSLFPSTASLCSNFMRHKTCLISPQLLEKYGVPFQKVVQEERDIIITFPYAYHQGFNHGFNIAESTNFAMPSWVEYGKRSKPCDCSRTRVSFSMDPFVKKFQPEKFDDWINKRDIAPHPMDPPDVVERIKLQLENPKEYAKLFERRRKGGKRKLKDDKENEDEESNTLKYDVYRHHQLANVWVYYNPETGKIRGGKGLLENFFENPNIPQLVEQGHLIKVNSVKMKCRKKKDVVIQPTTVKKAKTSEKKETKIEKKEKKRFYQAYKTKNVELVELKHLEEGFSLLVHPDSLRPAFTISKKVKEIIDQKDLKALVEENVFQIQGNYNLKLKQLASKPVIAPLALKCLLYLTTDTNQQVRITEDKKIVLDTHLEHVQQLLNETTAEDLVTSNRLEFSANVKLMRKSQFLFSTESPTNHYNPEDLIKESDLTDSYVEEIVAGDPELKKAKSILSLKVEDAASTAKEVISKLQADLSSSSNESYTFTQEGFVQEIAKHEELVIIALEMLEDLKLLSKIEHDGSKLLLYTWSGLDKKKILDNFVSLVEGIKDPDNSPAKKILRGVLLLLMEARKDVRVHLNHFAKTKFVNRRDVIIVALAGALFEALGFAKSVPNMPGVLLWVEENPYRKWVREQELIHLKLNTTVKVSKTDCPADMVEMAHKRLSDWLYPTINIKKSNMTEKMTKKKTNRKKRWRCGVCTACNTKPCGVCRHCTIKSLKQTCIMRACKKKVF